MPILHKTRAREVAAPVTGPAQVDETGRAGSSPGRPAPARGSVPPTRASAAWAGLWAAAVVLIAFIVFLLSNTGSVQISFAGFHGDLPLAVALLIAMVTGVVVTLIVGTARLTQIRRLARKRRQ